MICCCWLVRVVVWSVSMADKEETSEGDEQDAPIKLCRVDEGIVKIAWMLMCDLASVLGVVFDVFVLVLS